MFFLIIQLKNIFILKHTEDVIAATLRLVILERIIAQQLLEDSTPLQRFQQANTTTI